LGIGDWGLGIGVWGLGPMPNPQSPFKYLNFLNNFHLSIIININITKTNLISL